jgi:O-methyltransferase
MLKKIKQFVRNYIDDKYIFRIHVQEKTWRRMFFYNAFQALSFNRIDGDYVEFGSCGGKTFALAYHESRRHKHNAKLWSFDSFQGLPASKGYKDNHPVWKEGTMSMPLQQFYNICADNKIPRAEYHVVPGFYDEVLPAMSSTDEPRNIALAYIDCDLYSSTKTVLEFLMPRLKHGMIIAFDDYFCWSASEISGERRAEMEFFSNNTRWALLPYMHFGWHGKSYVVEDRKIVKI